MTTEPPAATVAPLSTATPSRRVALPDSIPAALLAGTVAGALWGVVARGWMRLISAELEFSWGGTAAIVIIFALFGFGQSVAAVTRRPGHGRRAMITGRVVAVVTTLPMGMAAGAMMLPFILLAAIARGRTGMRRAGRLAFAGLAMVPPLLVLLQLLDELAPARAVIGWLLMFVIYLPLVLALAAALRPFPAPPSVVAADHVG